MWAPLRRLADPSVTPLWALSLFWTLPLWAMQEWTLECSLWEGVWQIWLDRGIRLVLDFLACAVAVIVLPRFALVGLIVATGIASIGLTVYYDYFSHPLSMLTILNTASEGVDVTAAGVSLLHGGHAAMAGLVIIQALLANRIKRDRKPIPRGWILVFALVLSYGATMTIANVARKKMWKIATWESVAGIGYIYGYTPTWMAELLFVREEQVLERALRRGQQVSDRLSAKEPALLLGDRIVMVQVESLDWSLLGFQVHEKPVLPNINRLAETSFLLPIQAPKITGSCDSDFTALMARLPSSEVPTYRIQEYPYDDALPRRLHQFAVESWAIHGVSGSFLIGEVPIEGWASTGSGFARSSPRGTTSMRAGGPYPTGTFFPLWPNRSTRHAASSSLPSRPRAIFHFVSWTRATRRSFPRRKIPRNSISTR